MEKNNYLGNLPKRKSDLKKRSEERFYKYILDGLRNVESSTDNQILIDFKNYFVNLMCERIENGYNIDNYFDIRNVLTQMPEKLIIDLKDELIELLNKEDSENISIMESLSQVHYFPFLNYRVKTETGYINQTRDINVSDIFQAVNSVSREMEGFIMKYIENFITSSEMNLDELKILKEMIVNDNTNAYYNKFSENFKLFKESNVSVFKKLYDIYYNELYHKFIKKINREINKQGLHEQHERDKEYTEYARGFILRNERNKRNKRNHWYRH